MAETKQEIIKKYRIANFEIYYNCWTDRYHLLEHLGWTKSKKAWRVNLIGKYEDYMDAKASLDEVLANNGFVLETIYNY